MVLETSDSADSQVVVTASATAANDDDDDDSNEIVVKSDSSIDSGSEGTSTSGAGTSVGGGGGGVDGGGYGGSSSSSSFSSGVGSGKKLREIIRRQKPDSDDEEEAPDVDFEYADEDCLSAELAELYSYTEAADFQLCQKAYDDVIKRSEAAAAASGSDITGSGQGSSLPKTWTLASLEAKQRTIQTLLDQLEVASRQERLIAARALLYIAQGCWLECQSDAECIQNIQENVVLLYQNGVFVAFVDLLNLEMENGEAASSALRKLAVSLADSTELRVVLSLLYTVTLVLRTHPDQQLRQGFAKELNTPMGNENGELLAIRLLTMVTRFCSGSAPHFPMKKCLLLLWKVLLTSMGGMERLRELKTKYRSEAGLPVDGVEDTLTTSRTMRAASPPANASGVLEATNNGGGRRNRPGIKRSMMAKQSSLDDVGLELDNNITGEDADDYENNGNGGGEDSGSSSGGSGSGGGGGGYEVDSPRPDTPILSKEEEEEPPRTLPWTPKVRQKELDGFLDYTRMKFVGFKLQEDRTTLAGLPKPIHEGVRILNSYLYKSLGEVQIEREEEMAKYPISKPEPEVDQTPAEVLYQHMFPSLPQYMIALLKILLAAAPTSKAKTDSINIVTDVLPEEMPMAVVQSLKLGIDVNRHKEIIVKSVSAILLLLLKHFRINHIYQFEFMSQHLVFANCIPLVLKFFNQNIMAYIGSKNSIALLDFPSCVIGEQPPAELTSETLDVGSSPADSLTSLQSYCWRNMFSCINLLRVLNKLTKWKRSRIMMLVVFKSAPILKRTLKVKHAMLQLYVLKLLKMQSRYLGRQWRKSNMKTVSAIYTKVRHRLNEDWAYGNDVDSRPWDYQAEECALRCAVDRFNHRRYETTNKSLTNSQMADAVLDQSQQTTKEFMDDFEPVDNCLSSVLGQTVELTDEFKANYEKWLEREVYGANIRWELLLSKQDRDTLQKEVSLFPPIEDDCGNDGGSQPLPPREDLPPSVPREDDEGEAEPTKETATEIGLASDSGVNEDKPAAASTDSAAMASAVEEVAVEE